MIQEATKRAKKERMTRTTRTTKMEQMTMKKAMKKRKVVMNVTRKQKGKDDMGLGGRAIRGVAAGCVRACREWLKAQTECRQ